MALGARVAKNQLAQLSEGKSGRGIFQRHLPNLLKKASIAAVPHGGRLVLHDVQLVFKRTNIGRQLDLDDPEDDRAPDEKISWAAAPGSASYLHFGR